MGRFIVQKDDKDIASFSCRGEAENFADEINGTVVIMNGRKYIHCTNCEHFDWWDGDYVCLKDFPTIGHLIQRSPDGTFKAEFPEQFNAFNCDYYKWNRGYGVGDTYFEEYFKKFPMNEND